MNPEALAQCRSLSAAAAQHGLQPSVVLHQQQQPRALAVRQAMRTTSHVQHQHQRQHTCSVNACRAGPQAAFYSSTQQQQWGRAVCHAGKSSGDSKAPTDISNNMDDMVSAFLILSTAIPAPCARTGVEHSSNINFHTTNSSRLFSRPASSPAHQPA